MFHYEELSIPGVWLIRPQIFGDQRGYFAETLRYDDFYQITRAHPFVQENESASRRGVLRGLHLQTQETQGKLVRCIYGSIIDVAVDLRPDSAHFGKYIMRQLDDVKKEQLYIPRGFAHGFLVTSEWAVFSYKVDNHYAPQYECSVSAFDTEIGIDWERFGLSYDELILSEKDKNSVTLQEYKKRYL